jgi:hypothetical protein
MWIIIYLHYFELVILNFAKVSEITLLICSRGIVLHICSAFGQKALKFYIGVCVYITFCELMLPPWLLPVEGSV